ncbi:hypothetical protein RUM43_000863 [Polyplax serrata]|uniref:YTH domain-containing protein n=1 Tax=Polyplax serrata TaxID=468196 RepID=A0AAN8SGY1_POLSC
MKGQGNQVANGPKDHIAEQEDFESWRSTQQHQQAYTTPISTTSDPYTMSNYYNTGFTGYPTFGVGDGTWSNGGDPMGFLSGYTGDMGHGSYGMDGMFGGGGGTFSATGGGFGTFGGPTAAAGFNYFHGNGDYSTWGSSPAAMSRKPHYDDYYREGIYSTGPADGNVKNLEQSMQNISLDSSQLQKSDVKDLKESKDIPAAPKKMTWASVASQPAKPQPTLPSGGMKKKGPGMPPPPMIPGKHLDIGTWEGKNGTSVPKAPVGPPPAAIRPAWAGPSVRPRAPAGPYPTPPPHPMTMLAHPSVMPQPTSLPPPPSITPMNHPVLDELRVKNNYNPTEFDMNCKGARFFVIKSYSEDDIHRSIKYEIWCSTEHGNKRLDQAFRESEKNGSGPIYLFFSVNGSGHFCGMAQMVTPVDYHASSSVWSQDKWKGQFRVRWLYVKDVPNNQLRHIKLENNENKPVTNSRDTQEVPFEKGRQVLKVIHQYRHSTSIFDDFIHYEKRQEEEVSRKMPEDVREGRQQGRTDDRDDRGPDHRDERRERDHRPQDRESGRSHQGGSSHRERNDGGRSGHGGGRGSRN